MTTFKLKYLTFVFLCNPPTSAINDTFHKLVTCNFKL